MYYAPNLNYIPRECHVPYIPAPKTIPPRNPTPTPPHNEVSHLAVNVWWNPHSEEPQHWILNPRLDGLTIQVAIMAIGSDPKHSAWVTVSQGKVTYADQPTVHCLPSCIHKPIIPPKPNTEKGLLVVIHGEHTGKLVRQVHYFKLDGVSWFIAGVVKNGGKQGEEELTTEIIEVSCCDVVLVQETKGAKKWGNKVFAEARKAKINKKTKNLFE
ncbi:hypothetical protein VKT23_013635 [Stygiomarasmius scandens]|uniref:Uncharacterized protein n=1 Tax=Marasmiellus scandens TaxID=2682957 RepID=A0ABR1J855_9AGAR